jgi:hypothetical protein
MFGVPNCVDKDRVSTYQKSIVSTDLHKTLTIYMTDGEVLRHFIDNQHRTKKSIYTDLGISKQSLFQYFQTHTLTDEVKKRFEDYFGKEIFTAESKAKVSTDRPAQSGGIDDESRRTLERTLENLSEDKIRSTAIIERLVTMLEKQFSSGVLSKNHQANPVGPENNVVSPGFARVTPLGKGEKEKPKSKH